MSTITTIIPAAGLSRRMGSAKQLLKLGGVPVIVHCISTVLAARSAEVIVILNPLHEAIHREIEGLAVSIVMSSDPKGDMADSLRDGLQAISGNSTAVLIFPVDYPLVNQQTVTQLFSTHNTWPDDILIPVFGGRRGHPILLPVEAVRKLHSMPTLRDVVRHIPGRIREVTVTDEAVLFDMDTPHDYEMIREKWQQDQPA